MVKRISEDEFIQAFKDMNRENNFSFQGLRALYEYLENYSEDTGEEYELDVTALCVEFTEYKDIEEFKESFQDDSIETLDDLEEYTTVIRIEDIDTSKPVEEWKMEETGGFIIQDF